MNNKKLGVMALAIGLTFANISVSQAHGHMQNNATGMMTGGKMHGGMMNGGMMHGGMMHGDMIFSQLSLTTDQQQKIQSIMTTAMASMSGGQNMMTSMQAHMAESQALLNSPTFNEAKAREMISKHQALMVESQLQMLKAHHQAFQVLTEAQKEQVSTLMAEHLALMEQHMKGFKQ